MRFNILNLSLSCKSLFTILALPLLFGFTTAISQAQISNPGQAEEQIAEQLYLRLDFSRALPHFQAAADEGNAEACSHLSAMYQFGYGVPQDREKAAEWAKRATAMDGSNESPSDSTRSQLTVGITNIQSAENQCAKNISFAVAEGGQVISRTPKFAQKWAEKNQRKYPGICFSQTPNLQTSDYVLIFSTSEAAFNGVYPTVRSNTSTSISPVSGNGTLTDNNGGTWNYTYDGTVTTTTTTTSQEYLPYTDTNTSLFAFGYDQRGALVCREQKSVSSRQGGDPYNTLGYNLGSRLAAIHIKERLLESAVKDIAALPN